MFQGPPGSTLFPYTTLFRSAGAGGAAGASAAGAASCAKAAVGTSAAKAATVESRDRKSTRLNSSHVEISYAVFCLKKKKNLGGPRRLRASLRCRRTTTRR